MTQKSVIIIGAGLAGLSTGCYAQMNGYRSHVFEHHSVPGGVAACWQRGEYLIDGGIHFLMSHKPESAIYDLYHELGIIRDGHFPDLTDYGRFVDETSGRDVTITGNLDRLAADLKAIDPADAGLIDDLVAGARAMQGADMGAMGMSKPPELAGRLDTLKQLWGMRRYFRFFVGKYNQPLSEYAQAAHDPWLRTLVENLFLPEVPAWFAFMLLALLADGQMGLLADGSLAFARSIERRYLELGGQVTYKATVEEILVDAERDKAVGVRLADGATAPAEHRADVVVSAADGRSTIFKLLGGRYVDDEISKRYETWGLIRPTVMVNYGVARAFAGEPHLTTLKLARPFPVGQQAIEVLMVRIFNYGERFAPPGKTVVQVTFETAWDYWHDLREKDRPGYKAEKARVAAEVLERLEAHWPGLSAQV
ncbi:MAG: NAD(P)-binding protein, partial [Chloroflexi bacterium]|nr:NAD(P)-binding protein [Chloroflexota bacterium]